jgi:hypothetical protein
LLYCAELGAFSLCRVCFISSDIDRKRIIVSRYCTTICALITPWTTHVMDNGALKPGFPPMAARSRPFFMSNDEAIDLGQALEIAIWHP